MHDDERTVFVAVQHPGEEGTFDAFPTNAPPDARSRMWVFRLTLAHVCGSFGRRLLTLFKGVSERLGFWPHR